MRRLLAAVVFSTLLGSIASASLASRINSIISRPSQKKARFSIHIVEADSGKTVYRHRANTAMIPASNMKIIVTAAALKYLGPDYKWETRVGLWKNSLVVIGAGDPLLGDQTTDAGYGREPGWILDDIAAALKEAGVKAIEDIIVDTSIFDDERVHPNWPKGQLNRWYACEVSGLNFNDNCIEMTVKNVGGRILVSAEPKTGFIRIINKVRPISKGKGAVGAYRTLEPNKIIVKGKCRKEQGPFDVAIENPALFFTHLLAENLQKNGISVEGQITEAVVRNSRRLRALRQYNSSMTDCLARCNKNSLGLAAEALLKTVAAHANPDGKKGGWEGGRKVISEYLDSLRIGQSEFYIDDASGLSRKNRLSANAITKVLSSVYNSPHRQIYKESLAAGGVDGTIRKYFKQQEYKGKVFGKTGYISGVRSFSGVCTAGRGDFIFSILANTSNGKTRTAINDIVEAVIDTQ
ncbi:MAG: D-alanyl-D-alanine carboxypeptidase/D-alanyl-D-alanine endopeptidase [Planctomycetota bacterium]